MPIGLGVDEPCRMRSGDRTLDWTCSGRIGMEAHATRKCTRPRQIAMRPRRESSQGVRKSMDRSRAFGRPSGRPTDDRQAEAARDATTMCVEHSRRTDRDRGCRLPRLVRRHSARRAVRRTRDPRTRSGRGDGAGLLCDVEPALSDVGVLRELDCAFGDEGILDAIEHSTFVDDRSVSYTVRASRSPRCRRTGFRLANPRPSPRRR